MATTDETDADRDAARDLVGETPIVRLAEHPTAVRALQALAVPSRAGQVLTAREIAEAGDFSVKSWYGAVEELLLQFDLIERAGKKGNATTYRAKYDTDQFEAFVSLDRALARSEGSAPDAE
jgi:hypothetical protein